MSNLEIPNHSVLEPDLYAIEIFKSSIGYNPIIAAVLDKEKNEIIYFKTEIWEDSALEACRKALKGAMWLFEKIANICTVIDIESGDIVEEISLNKIFPSWQNIDDAVDTIPENRILH